MKNEPSHSHYPDYNVMDQQNAWDSSTQKAITQRISQSHTASGMNFFSLEEKELLYTLLPLLFPYPTSQLTIDAVSLLDLRFFTNQIQGFPLGSSIAKHDVMKKGLSNLQKQIALQFQTTFSLLSTDTQSTIVAQISNLDNHTTVWQTISPKLFFTTLMNECITIMYSDPSIWSLIGYGGPAYPRGYYSFGLEQFDEWEATINPS